ncbi:MAG: EndoU domain-containing protein [Sandaracinaceae bacterium]|nr:EndoU domain-containing protein [Sandaracinaceae bacterium]
MFYERGIGAITNGRDVGGRPSALYLTTNIPSTGVESGWEGAGWVEASYGVSGNVTSFTVHGQCTDAPSAGVCADLTGTLSERLDNLRANCACADEQHYSFRWDERNRLVDGRRHDRVGGMWTPAARMRYRYDGANQRTVKESFAEASVSLPERYTLYVYPGDFERRGLTITFDNDGLVYQATEGSGPDATETQYLIAGARIVWDAAPSITSLGIDRNRRATVNASDLLGTTAASLDLLSGALLEVSTYYPNGARENLWTNEADVPLEPMGFTGKEADEEIGVTYFGERWLIPRLGRWATPDPLHVHAAGGGETLNSYHYTSGDLAQRADVAGLQLSARAGGDEGRCTPMAATPGPDASELEQENYRVMGALQLGILRGAAVNVVAVARPAIGLALFMLGMSQVGGHEPATDPQIPQAPRSRTEAALERGTDLGLLITMPLLLPGPSTRTSTGSGEASAAPRRPATAAEPPGPEAGPTQAVAEAVTPAEPVAESAPTTAAAERPPGSSGPCRTCAVAETDGCFPEETLVHTTGRPRPIEDVRTGHRVEALPDSVCDTGPFVGLRVNVEYPDGGSASFLRRTGQHGPFGDVESSIPGGGVAGARLTLLEVVELPGGPGCLVTGVMRRSAEVLVGMRLSDGAELRATPEHPLLLADGGGVVAVAQLEPGSVLQALRGTVAVVGLWSEAGASVVNLEVDGVHSFPVGSAGIIAHNTCGPYRVSQARRSHILDGDPGRPGSGHGPRRGSEEGAFPDTWTDDQVVAAIERVANSPQSTWRQATGPGYTTAPVSRGGPAPNSPATNSTGTPVRYRVRGRDHGISIQVIVEPGGEGIVSGYNMDAPQP